MSVICVLLWQSAKMYQDLSHRARRFQDEALRDKLTGLANRRRFDDTISALVAQSERRGDRLALAFVDIDRFKRFNDLHGHLAGDACLQRVANAISATLRPGDFVARYGGEEFVVVLDDTDAIAAARLFERVRVAVAETSATPQHPSVTISIGVTMLREHDDVVKLVGRADTALYGAKSAGRNRVVFTDDLYRALAAS
jgi:diguanylate cyclase (GGDEF)-like protein